VAPATPAAAPAPEAPAAAAPHFDGFELPTGGKLKLGTTLQAWYEVTERGNEDWSNGFRLRRTEIKLYGDLVPNRIAFKLMVDPARVLDPETRTIDVDYPDDTNPGGSVDVAQSDRTSIVQDVEITYRTPFADVSVGQFKTPISLESQRGSNNLLLAERSDVSLRYGEKRELALKVEKRFEYFYYMAGVYNGGGQNRPDNDEDKDLALRLEVTPIKQLMIGGVGYASVGKRESANTRDRVEGDLQISVGDFLFTGEYIHAWDGPDGDDRKEGHGFAGAAAYTLGSVQPVARLSFVDTDLDANPQATDESYNAEVGVNYLVEKRNFMLTGVVGERFLDNETNALHVLLAAQLTL
jgi:hypothetical protein